MTRHFSVAIFGLVLAVSITGQAQTLLDPIPYRQRADSPFHGLALEYFFLEDFEDGALNTPGVVATTDPPDSGRVNDGDARDSVDGDDGVLDGTGRTGRSWYLGFEPRLPGGQIKAIFTFNPGVLGGLPTHVGLVWTDVGFLNGMSLIAQAEVVFEAFDGNGVSLGQVGPVLLGDGQYTGEALEDRFFGAVYLGGLSRVELTTLDSADWELDHLQYGRMVVAASPAAAQLSVAKTGATAAVGRVVSTPPAINCGGACQGLFPVAAPPLLVAVPTRGSVFIGWEGGGCTGPGLCTPSLVESQSSQVTARFDAPPDRPVILSWPQAVDGSALSGTTVPIVFTVPPGATIFGLEFTGLNRVFGNPSGLGLDPVNGFGGAGGGILIPGPTFDLALPPDLDDGVYQIRVVGLDAQLQPVSRFSEPLSIVVGAVTGGVPNLTSPGPGAVLPRGTPVTFEWMSIPFASQYLFTFAGGPDPTMVAGSVMVQTNSLPVVIPPDIPPGGYRLRVMGLDAGGQPQGAFSTLDVTVQ